MKSTIRISDGGNTIHATGSAASELLDAMTENIANQPDDSGSLRPQCSTTSSTPNLDYLREQVSKLKLLLDDPHPGLITWRQMYGERMTAINDFWNAKQ